MKIYCATFTCARDAERAAYHARHLPEDWEHVWIIESRDADACAHAAPPGTEILVREFDRGASLRGNSAVEGMAAVFREFAERREADLVIKLDSDTEIFRPEAFTEPARAAGVDFTYVRRLSVEGRLLANGCCYAMSRRAVLRLREFSTEKHARPNFAGHEDLIFSAFFTVAQKDLTLCQIDKTRWSWSEAPRIAADTYGAHNGYLSPAADFALCEQIRALRAAYSPLPSPSPNTNTANE